jgi:hypothetical protein
LFLSEAARVLRPGGYVVLETSLWDKLLPIFEQVGWTDSYQSPLGNTTGMLASTRRAHPVRQVIEEDHVISVDGKSYFRHYETCYLSEAELRHILDGLGFTSLVGPQSLLGAGDPSGTVVVARSPAKQK